MIDNKISQSYNDYKKKRKNFPVFLLAMLIYVCSTFSVRESTIITVATSFIVFIISQGKINRFFINLIWPLFFIMILGVIQGPLNELENFFRDFVYVLTPISTLLISFWMCNHLSLSRFVNILIVSGISLSVFHVSKFLHDFSIFSDNASIIRATVGSGYYLVPIVLNLIFFRNYLGYDVILKNKFARLFSLLICSLALFLFFSRTIYIVTIIIFLVNLSLFFRVRSRIFIATFYIIFAIAALIIISPNVYTYFNQESVFIKKIERSFSEIKVKDYSSMSDINENWRGYETYRAMVTYADGNWFQILIGQGFGALVDLDVSIRLGSRDEEGKYFRFIPVFHNGYVFILLKTGIIGIILYIIFFVKIFKFIGIFHCGKFKHKSAVIRRFVFGCVLSLLFLTYVVGGFFGNTEIIPIFLTIGFLVSYIKKYRFTSVLDDND